eukprot:c5852_g1_i1.p1 GENE.c5852_g1_i1~~c5852_g1_i1.p1  ORF type:complete len:212 (+),score=47.26 c5852_g1_i1:47-682(+)
MAKSVGEVLFFIPNLIGYVRVASALLAIWVGRTNWVLFTFAYFTAFALDALDGMAARKFNQCSTFGSVLDMVTDRCSTAMLLVLLGVLHPDSYFIWAFCLALDISSHWFHMYSSLLAGAHHKSKDAQHNFIMALYYGNFYFFVYLCVGAEVYYIVEYLLAFSTQLPPLLLTFVSLLEYAVLPGFLLKQFVNIIQLSGAAATCARKDVSKSG